MDNQNPIDIMNFNKMVPEAFHTTEPQRSKNHSHGNSAVNNQNYSGSGRYIAARNKPVDLRDNNYTEQTFNQNNANKPPTPPRKKNNGFHPMKQIQETHGAGKSNVQNKNNFTSRSGHVQKHPTSYSNPPKSSGHGESGNVQMHHPNQSLKSPPSNLKNNFATVNHFLSKKT